MTYYTTSKIYDNFKTTVPKKVRIYLDLKDGDELLYKIEKGIVFITKNDTSHIKKRFEVLTRDSMS